MPMYRRLPKRGFTNPFQVENQVVNLSQLKKVSATEVSPETLYAAGLIGKRGPARSSCWAPATPTGPTPSVACSLSASARAKIEAAGGKIEA